MSILDRKFPFVISHTIWKRKPQKKRVRHFRGFIPGVVRLAVKINRSILDIVEDAFFEDEVITEDNGAGITRHFAFDVGMAMTPAGDQVPVLKGVETTRAPACVHHYVSNRMANTDDDYDEPVTTAPHPPSNPMRRQDLVEHEAPILDQLQADLSPSSGAPPGEIEGDNVFVSPSNNGTHEKF